MVRINVCQSIGSGLKRWSRVKLSTRSLRDSCGEPFRWDFSNVFLPTLAKKKKKCIEEVGNFRRVFIIVTDIWQLHVFVIRDKFLNGFPNDFPFIFVTF